MSFLSYSRWEDHCWYKKVIVYSGHTDFTCKINSKNKNLQVLKGTRVSFVSCLLQLIITPGRSVSGDLRQCAAQLQTQGSWSASRPRWPRSAARCPTSRVKWWRHGESPALAHREASWERSYLLSTPTRSLVSWTCWREGLQLGPGPAATVSTTALLR